MRFLEQVCVMGSGTQMTAKACWALVQVNKGYARNCHGHFIYNNLFDLSVVIVYIIRLRLRVIQQKSQSFVCLFKFLVWFPCVTLWKIPGSDKPYQAFYITYVHVFWPMYMCFDDENQACGLCLSKIWRVSFYLWKNCILQVSCEVSRGKGKILRHWWPVGLWFYVLIVPVRCFSFQNMQGQLSIRESAIWSLIVYITVY